MELDTSYLFTSSKHQTWGLNFSEDGPAMTLQNGRDRQNDGNVNGGKCMEKCFFDHQSFFVVLKIFRHSEWMVAKFPAPVVRCFIPLLSHDSSQ